MYPSPRGEQLLAWQAMPPDTAYAFLASTVGECCSGLSRCCCLFGDSPL